MTRVAYPVVPGQELLAEDWNDIIRRLRASEDRLRTRGNNKNPGALVTFQYASTDGDVLFANRVRRNGTVDTAQTAIAKPYTHRPSIGVRGGHTYSYVSDFERDDTLSGNVERQVLTPSYEVGDLVFATRVHQYSGVRYNFPPDRRIRWLQVNVDGRQWAKKFGT